MRYASASYCEDAQVVSAKICCAVTIYFRLLVSQDSYEIKEERVI